MRVYRIRSCLICGCGCPRWCRTLHPCRNGRRPLLLPPVWWSPTGTAPHSPAVCSLMEPRANCHTTSSVDQQALIQDSLANSKNSAVPGRLRQVCHKQIIHDYNVVAACPHELAKLSLCYKPTVAVLSLTPPRKSRQQQLSTIEAATSPSRRCIRPSVSICPVHPHNGFHSQWQPHLNPLYIASRQWRQGAGCVQVGSHTKLDWHSFHRRCCLPPLAPQQADLALFPGRLITRPNVGTPQPASKRPGGLSPATVADVSATAVTASTSQDAAGGLGPGTWRAEHPQGVFGCVRSAAGSLHPPVADTLDLCPAHLLLVLLLPQQRGRA